MRIYFPLNDKISNELSNMCGRKETKIIEFRSGLSLKGCVIWKLNLSRIGELEIGNPTDYVLFLAEHLKISIERVSPFVFERVTSGAVAFRDGVLRRGWKGR